MANFEAVLDSLITSKTRIRMLLKFFTNSSSTAYLRGLAEEFGESTNSIRHELNNLSKAGYLISSEEGRTIQYRVNTQHPLYHEVKSLVHKYLGIDKIVDNIISKLGDLRAAYIIGDYAQGKDSGTIELLLVGKIDKEFLKRLVVKAQGLIKRDIEIVQFEESEFEKARAKYQNALLVWGDFD